MLEHAQKNDLELPSTEVAERSDEDIAAIVIDQHDGDHVAAINALVQDNRHLRYQLALSSAAISKGLTRGWLPSPQR